MMFRGRGFKDIFPFQNCQELFYTLDPKLRLRFTREDIMYAGNFGSLRKPAITGDVPPLIGNQLYSQSRKKHNFIFSTTPTKNWI